MSCVTGATKCFVEGLYPRGIYYSLEQTTSAVSTCKCGLTHGHSCLPCNYIIMFTVKVSNSSFALCCTGSRNRVRRPSKAQLQECLQQLGCGHVSITRMCISWLSAFIVHMQLLKSSPSPPTQPVDCIAQLLRVNIRGGFVSLSLCESAAAATRTTRGTIPKVLTHNILAFGCNVLGWPAYTARHMPSLYTWSALLTLHWTLLKQRNRLPTPVTIECLGTLHVNSKRKSSVDNLLTHMKSRKLNGDEDIGQVFNRYIN